MGAVLSDITQGRRVRSVRAGGMTVHEVSYGPGVRMSAHAHARANITLVLGGGFSESGEEPAYGAAALGVVFKRSGVHHETSVGADGLRTVVIELSEADERRVWGETGLRSACVCVGTGAAARALLGAWVSTRRRDCVPAGELERALRELTDAAMAESSRRPTGRAAGMRGAIDSAPCAPPGTSCLAARFGMHPVSVTRVFRREFGCGVMDAVRASRVRAAAGMLSMSDAPLARIAARSGFADQSHMGRQFRRETGLTPGAYRRLSRGLDPF